MVTLTRGARLRAVSRQFTASTAHQRNGCLVAFSASPLFPVRLHPEFARCSPSVRLSVRLAVRLTVDVCLRRVPVREGSRVGRPGQAQGRLARGPVVVFGDPLRPCAGRRVAVAPPVGGREVGARFATRRPSGRSPRSPPPCLASPARRTRRRPSRTARTVSRSTSGRRSSRLHRRRSPGRGSPGDGLHPRGWLHFGQRVGLPLPGRGPGAQRRRRGRDHQLPARRPGLPGSSGPGRSGRAGRELGPAGPAGGFALGARQHRRLRR